MRKATTLERRRWMPLSTRRTYHHVGSSEALLCAPFSEAKGFRREQQALRGSNAMHQHGMDGPLLMTANDRIVLKVKHKAQGP